MKFSVLILAPLFAASYVSAHGIPHKVSTSYGEFNFNALNTPIRPIADDERGSPLKVMDPAMSCGRQSRPAPGSIKVDAGKSISITWLGSDGSKWPHNTGPLMAYLADCDENDCKKNDLTGINWFKISQKGKKPDNIALWYQDDFYQKKDVPATVLIPKSLRRGRYLLRHEIVGLHLANGDMTSEHYPGCIQIEVQGGGNGAPTKDTGELVKFPGAYSGKEVGLRSGFYGPKPYTDFPGPPLAKLAQTKPPPTKGGDVNADSPAESSSQIPPSVCSIQPTPSNSGSLEVPPIESDSAASQPIPTPTPMPTGNYARRHLMQRARSENNLH